MTLDEAIKHVEEVAELNEWFDKNCLESMQCKKCAEEHRQLAEWLKDYKRLLEQQPCIQDKQANADKIDAVYIDGFKAGYSQARFDLEQQPCEDVISREAVIEWLKAKDIIKLSSQEETARKELKALSPVTPQKYGKWIDYSDEGFVECPFCGHATNCEDNIDELHYCFYCGCHMVEPQESEE